MAVSNASAAANEITAQQAELKLREYFEYPRKPLKECGYSGLYPSYDALKATSNSPALIFTSREDAGRDHPCKNYPVILTSSGKEWWSVETKLYSWNWDDVWTTPDRSKIWAILSFNCGDPGGNALILYSADGGWTWITLSKVDFYNRLDAYGTFRMAPDGHGVMVVGWDDENDGRCRICNPEECCDNCRGLDLFRTHDWGATWDKPISIHGRMNILKERKDADTILLTESIQEFTSLSFKKLQEHFQTIPAKPNSNQLPGAVSLAFDGDLLRKAKVPTKSQKTFLEISEGTTKGEPQFPYILEWGCKDERKPPLLIKLPYAGYQWQAWNWSSFGILQQANQKEGTTWIIAHLNKEQVWIAGSLPSLPSEPYSFNYIYDYQNGELELHVRRLLKADDNTEPGRYVYRSVDGGLSWMKPKFEADVLQPAISYMLRIAVALDNESDITLRKIMDSALSDIQQSNVERQSPPIKSPTVLELVELFRKTHWYMPAFGDEYIDSLGCPIGEPALHFAVMYHNGSLDLLKALVHAGADLHIRSQYYKESVLDYAVRKNAQEAIEYLRAQPFNWGESDKEGQTSLHWLASYLSHGNWVGSPEEITERMIVHAGFLLEQGADVNAKDQNGQTVLDVALAQKAPAELIQVFIKHGAIQEKKLENGR